MRSLSTLAIVGLATLISGFHLSAAPPEGRGNGVGQGRDTAPSALDRRDTGLSRRPADVGTSPAGLDRRPTDVGLSPAGLDRRPTAPTSSPGGIDTPTDRGSRGLGRSTERGDLNRNGRSLAPTSGERPAPRGNDGGLLGRFFGPQETADTESVDPSDSPSGDTPLTDRLRGRERFALTQADRLLAKRLADIDHLRDVAMRNGNVRLLEQADYLEELARGQYTRRTAGFDVPGTEPPMDPTTPMDPTDPMPPTNPTDPMPPMDPTDPMPPMDPTDPMPPMDPTDPMPPMDPTDPMPPSDPTDPMPPSDPTDPMPPTEPTDPMSPSDPIDPSAEPGEVVLGDIIPIEDPLP